MPALFEKTLFEKIVETIKGPILQLCVEALRLLPDSMVLGIAILAGLSMSKSMAVLLFTMFEIMLSQRALSMIIGGIAPVGAKENVLEGVCQTGFLYPNMMRISLIETIGVPSMFPSPSVFFITSTLTYMLLAMQNFGREIKSLSNDLGVRTNIATVLSGLFIIFMFIFRYTYGCESFGTLMLSVVLGLVFGALFVYQNIGLFGRDGINVLNIPIILSSAERGRPMYVCAPSNI